MMVKVFYDDDADLQDLAGETVAIIGYVPEFPMRVAERMRRALMR
jgi:hypothetical protein